MWNGRVRAAAVTSSRPGGRAPRRRLGRHGQLGHAPHGLLGDGDDPAVGPLDDAAHVHAQGERGRGHDAGHATRARAISPKLTPGGVDPDHGPRRPPPWGASMSSMRTTSDEAPWAVTRTARIAGNVPGRAGPSPRDRGTAGAPSTRGWDALSTDDAGPAWYDSHLAPEVLLLLPAGMVIDDHQAVVDSMGGPPWTSYHLEDERVLGLGPDAAVVAYRATAERPGHPTYEALFNSTWVRIDGRWRG